jgi:hypothetical protein
MLPVARMYGCRDLRCVCFRSNRAGHPVWRERMAIMLHRTTCVPARGVHADRREFA